MPRTSDDFYQFSEMSKRSLSEFQEDLDAWSPYAPWKAPNIANKFYHLSKQAMFICDYFYSF